MQQLRQYVRITLFTTLVLGLSLAWALKRHSPGLQSARGMVHYQHLPGTNRRGGSRNGQNLDGAAHSSSDRAETGVVPRLKPGIEIVLQVVAPSRMFLFVPQLMAGPLAHAGVVATGSAARAPGNPRGPPTLS